MNRAHRSRDLRGRIALLQFFAVLAWLPVSVFFAVLFTSYVIDYFGRLL